MKASSKIVASVPTADGVIVLDGYSNTTFEVAGCSCNCSARPKSAGLNSIAITEPTNVGNHFIALRASWIEGAGKNKINNSANFLVPILTDGFRVDLDNSWIPTADCLLQMDGYGHLEVRIEEDLFTTGTLYGAEKENANIHGDVDGDLMCRLATGQISPPEFREQVASWHGEQNLHQMVEAMKTALDLAQERANHLEEENDSLKEDLEILREANYQLPMLAAGDTAVRTLVEDLVLSARVIEASKPRWFGELRIQRKLAARLREFLSDIRAMHK